MRPYEHSDEATVWVRFRYDVEPGWAGDRHDPGYGDEVQNLQAVIIGPKGEELICPSWLADRLMESVGEEALTDSAQGYAESVACDSWAAARGE
jgi:hypothetical protein